MKKSEDAENVDEYLISIRNISVDGATAKCARKTWKKKGISATYSQPRSMQGTVVVSFFFDFETVQNKKIADGKHGPIYIHQPVCAVAQKVNKDGKEEDKVFLGETVKKNSVSGCSILNTKDT